MTTFGPLRVAIFADGADLASIERLAADPLIKGFTTNPTLMRAAGIDDYRAFARRALAACVDKPISFEVIADDFATMEAEAKELASWGRNVIVKIPITDTRGHPSTALIDRLARAGVSLNATALMTLEQVNSVARLLAQAPRAFVSVFAGRIADSGRDPMPIMRAAVEALRPYPNVQLIWASPREVLNVVQADAVGCHVITITNDLLKKLPTLGKDLNEFSLETVRMFYDDAKKSGITIPIREVAAAQ
jgi:transaldolase